MTDYRKLRCPTAALAVCLSLWMTALLAPTPLFSQDKDEAPKPKAKAVAEKAAVEAKKAAVAQEAAEAKKEAKAEEKKEEKKTEEKKDESKPAARNPLTDLIKKALQPNTTNPAAIPGVNLPNQPDGGKGKNADRNASDPRAPYDRKASDWMKRAQAHIKANEWKEALDLLQRICDQPEDSLIRTEAGKWISVRSEAQRLRGEAPEDLLNDYRTQYGGLARQLLAEAVRGGDLVAFAKVAKGFFHTDAGYEAANRLGTAHLDRGEFALAAHWFASLWQARAPQTNDPLWRTKAAFALKQAGQTELSSQILDQSSQASHKPVDLGGATQDPGKWLASAASVQTALELTLADWPMFYGTPRRTGVVAGGEPLLLPRWKVPLTESHPARTQIEYLTEDLADAGSMALPILFSQMVGGKIVFRTLHGVVVADAMTGRILWQSEEDNSAERQIAGLGNVAQYNEFDGGFGGGVMFNRAVRVWNGGMSYAYYGGQGEYSPLCNLLYRNANFGLISSDGKQLFVIDDPAFLTHRQPGQYWGWDGTQSLASSANKLVSYDLNTGRPLWEVGGPAYGEPFDPQLAGYFLFGPPTVDGGELFMVGEATVGDRSNQIRLICLDAATGAEKWSQLVAYSEASIEKDVGRRWWTAQAATSDGIIVCPTTVGWLIAVDRVTHSLLWGYNIPLANRNNRGFGEPNEGMYMVQQTQLGGVWGTTPPIISGGRVIYAPLESQNFVCLDQFTGKELWNKPRSNGLYIAGVFDGKVLVVGRDTTTAYDLANGNTLWNVKTGTPSGRGVLLADRYYLPLAAGEVWGIDLKTGNVPSKSFLPASVSGLGNLAMYRGMLLSLDVSGITAFEQRDALREEITRRKAANPRDAWAHNREAEISILNRNYTEALASLRQAQLDNAPAEVRERHRELLVETLAAVIRADFSRAGVEDDVKALAAAVSKPDEKQQLRRLEAEMHVARKEYEAAFDAYLALAEEKSEGLIPRDDNPAVKVRAELWVSGKLTDLLGQLPEAARGTINGRITALAADARKKPVEGQLRFLTLFVRHPESNGVRLALAENYAARGDFLPAEHLLLQLQQNSDMAIAAAATERLARLMLDTKLPADAAYHYHELETRFAAAVLPGGKTGAQTVQALRDVGVLAVVDPTMPDWHIDELRVEKMGANYSQYYAQELNSTGSPLPFFRHYRMEVEQQTQRLEVIHTLSDQIHWSLPLRAKAGSNEGGYALAQSHGHQLTLLHRGVLHALSPVDKKILWTHPLETRAGQSTYYGRNQNPLQPMQQALSLTNRRTYAYNMGAGLGLLSLSNNEIVCYQGRRNITVLDSLTGEVRWTCTGVRPGALLLGGDDILYLRPADGRNPVAYRAADGKQLDIPDLGNILSRALHTIGNDFVLTGVRDNKAEVRLYDPLGKKDRWKADFPRGTFMSVLDNDLMAFLEPDGKFQLLDLPTGKLSLIATLTADDLKSKNEVYAFADNSLVYLLVNKGNSNNYYSENIPFVRANGQMFAFDPAAGKQLWKQPVAAQNLMLERFDFSPLVVFAARKYEQKGKLNYWSLHLVAFDKLTGNKLLDEKSAGQPGFRSITVSTAERYVELRGYNERIRLHPVEKTAAAGASGGE